MNNEIEGFVFYKSFYDAISQIEEIDKKCEVYTAIFEYCFFGIEPNLSGTPNIIWTLMKPQIDNSISNYLNGKKGGAPKGNQNAKKQPKTTENNPPCIVDQTTQTTNKNNNKNNNTNNNKNTDVGGWEKVIGLFPPTKHQGLVEAAIVWNNLDQKEKQSVMRHLNPYIKNTDEKFMKQIGNYFNERMWENMKSKPTSNKIKMLDYNFIEWIKEELEFKRFDEARSHLATIQINDRELFNELENEYKQSKIN
jgi:hypothetical protein